MLILLQKYTNKRTCTTLRKGARIRNFFLLLVSVQTLV